MFSAMFDSGHNHAFDSLAPFPINMPNNPWPILPIPTNRSANALCPPPYVTSSLLSFATIVAAIPPHVRHLRNIQARATTHQCGSHLPPGATREKEKAFKPFAIRKRLLVRLPTLSKASRFRSTSMLPTPTMAPLVVTSRGLHLHFPRLIPSDLPFQRLPG